MQQRETGAQLTRTLSITKRNIEDLTVQNDEVKQGPVLGPRCVLAFHLLSAPGQPFYNMGSSEVLRDHLCSLCSRLDIRALLLAAQDGAEHRKLPVWYDLDQAELESESRLIFKHHPNLLQLKRTSPSCHLCAEIWRCFCGNVGISEEVSDTDLTTGLGETPLYMILSREEAQEDRLPKLVVFQHARQELTRIIASFDICCERGTKPSDCEYRFADMIYADSGSEEAISLVREWMDTCISKHRRCNHQSRTLKSPSRLLDLTGDPRMIDAQGDETFAALSYSWGGESALMLTAMTEGQFRKKLPSNALPPTMVDAVTISKKLNVRYLWIDALCIFQDSKEDFAAECSKMRDIYRGAVVTINGTSAAKISDNLFKRRSIRHVELPWPNGKTPVEYVYLREDSNITVPHLKSAHINTRGWCLQESLLARRSLWIGEQQMIFECAANQVDESGRRAVATEDYRSKRFVHYLSTQERTWFKNWLFRACGIPSVTFVPFVFLTWRTFLKTWDVRRMFRFWTYKAFLPPALVGPSDTWLTTYDYWREIVYQYTQRQLSHPEDVFPALSGLTDAFYRATGEEFVAGAWRGDLIRSLNWNREISYDDARKHAILEAHREVGYLAPSWSWASIIHGIVKFSPAMPNKSISETNYRKTDTATILNVWTKPATADRYGRLSDGEIVIRGRFIGVPHPLQPPSSESNLPEVHTFIYNSMSLGGRDVSEFEIKHRGYSEQRFGLIQTCIEQEVNITDPIIEMNLLLIETTTTSTELDAGQKWRRLAHFCIRLSGRSRLGFDTEERRTEFKRIKWDTRTVCIV